MGLLAHLSRRLKQGIHNSMAVVHSHCPFTFLKKYISNVSWPNVIKFYVKHQVEGKAAKGFWAD